jgi:hypothetical protein
MSDVGKVCFRIGTLNVLFRAESQGRFRPMADFRWSARVGMAAERACHANAFARLGHLGAHELPIDVQ